MWGPKTQTKESFSSYFKQLHEKYKIRVYIFKPILEKNQLLYVNNMIIIMLICILLQLHFNDDDDNKNI